MTLVAKAIPTQNVFLLHGIWMPRLMMLYLGRKLKKAGYRPHYFGYLGVINSPERIVQGLRKKVTQEKGTPLYFVAHSLGGLILLRFLAKYPEIPVAKVVLLGSPINGSHVAQTLARHVLGRLVLGKSKDLLVSGIKPIDGLTVGMIAGNFGLGVGRLFSRLDKPRDGAVFVDETQASWLSDHHTLRHSHTGMLFSSTVAKLITHYFHQGRFE